MPVYNIIDGINRENWLSYANMNGVMRNIDIRTMIDGVWRTSHRYEITEEDITGFRLIYKLNKEKKYPGLDHIKFNHRLPIHFRLTGEDTYGINFRSKGVVYEYDHIGSEEGIICYEANLYAVLSHDEDRLINVSYGDIVNEENIVIIPSIIDSTNINRLYNLTIHIKAYTLYEANGYHINGWNSIFDTYQFIDHSDISQDIEERKRNEQMIPRIILPIANRAETYYPLACIGIARDMTSTEFNMVGSHGVLDHTIDFIEVNGVTKPFSIEIYN
jgi:hypothetical protein